MTALPCNDSPLIAKENQTYKPDYAQAENFMRRMVENGVTPDEIEAFTTQRIEWIQAGCPGTFHDFRNR